MLQLWSAIEKGNFTDAEKQSFLEELKHFERRIEKHKHFRSLCCFLSFCDGKTFTVSNRTTCFHSCFGIAISVGTAPFDYKRVQPTVANCLEVCFSRVLQRNHREVKLATVDDVGGGSLQL